VEEAIDLAIRQLGTERDQVEIEILEEPSKGLFGLLGSRLARVRVTVKEDPGVMAKEFLARVFAALGVKVFTEVYPRDESILLNITGEDLGILIGRRGETLDALQYLVNLSVNRRAHRKVRIILDVEGYRQRREEALIKLARRMSSKAKRTDSRVILEPMNSQERRIIHTALQNDSQVYTYSEGEDPFRKVIIAPKKGNGKTQ
jgi:spoIIIJ-associated protein